MMTKFRIAALMTGFFIPVCLQVISTGKMASFFMLIFRAGAVGGLHFGLYNDGQYQSWSTGGIGRMGYTGDDD